MSRRHHTCKFIGMAKAGTTLLNDFKEFIQEENLLHPKQKVLLAVSGGVDSMVMLELFRRSNFNFGVAHCNFQLRAAEADGDQDFVDVHCRKHNIPFHTVSFNTTEYAQEQKLSIQMAARELRYNWFDRILKQENYQLIATAHHKGDVVETFFINLSRGTGIRGLSGIKTKNGELIRPILFANRKQIDAFATDQNILFREDSSNASVKYLRNKIRHDIIPAFEEMFPNYSDTVLANIERLKEVEEIFHSAVAEQKKHIVAEERDKTVIDITRLKKLSPLSTYLFEFLRPFDFNSDTIDDIIACLHKHPGRQFFSTTHRLIKDREKLIVLPLDDDSFLEYLVERNETEVHLRYQKSDELHMQISLLKEIQDFRIPNDNLTGAFDAEKIQFPLKLRKWEKGDIFFPLGMPRKKKVSDFFSDNKFSIDQKEETWLLTSKGKIVWIVGHRIDDRFKITDKTKKVLLLNVTKNE